MQCIQVTIQASDPISEAGIIACLQCAGDIEIVSEAERASADVLVLATERISANVVEMLRTAAVELDKPTVLITNDIKKEEVLIAVECGVVTILPRAAAGDDRLVRGIRAAATGMGELPPDLLGALLRHVEHLQREVLAPEALGIRGLTTRETSVLRLLADGVETREIAHELSYSERTVKNIIHSITSKLQLRNRQHAVAYAVRAGII